MTKEEKTKCFKQFYYSFHYTKMKAVKMKIMKDLKISLSVFNHYISGRTEIPYSTIKLLDIIHHEYEEL